MTVRVHRPTQGTYWRWTCDTCDLWDSAGDWDEAMEAATGHAVYRHAKDVEIARKERTTAAIWTRLSERARRFNESFCNPGPNRYHPGGL